MRYGLRAVMPREAGGNRGVPRRIGRDEGGRWDVKVMPCTVKAAQKFVAEHHRHLKKVQGGLFAAAVAVGGKVVGVAIAGNPARVWQGTGRIAILRVATDGSRNACSMLYGSLCRAAQALGYREVWTYTLQEEPGTSLRASGFVEMGATAGGEHDRVKRRRAPAVRPEPKRRWCRTLGGGT